MAAIERSIVAALALLFVGASSAECLQYGAQAALAGRVETRDYPGPPHYRDIGAGDQKQTVFLLLLENPVCIRSDTPEESLRDVRALQLAFDWSSPQSSAAYQAVASGLGSRFSLSGELFRGTAREHRTPVMLLVAQSGG